MCYYAVCPSDCGECESVREEMGSLCNDVSKCVREVQGEGTAVIMNELNVKWKMRK